jgi:hypothetical protein
MPKPKFLRGRDALVWSREYSHTDAERCNCELLEQTLAHLGSKRMVVGHTIQPDGINGACDNKVLRCAATTSACHVYLWYSGACKPALQLLKQFCS